MLAQVDLLGILFIIWGLLTALVGVSTLALGAGAVALIASASGGHVAAGVTAAVFLVLAAMAIVWGAAHVAIGLPLRRHRPSARILALVLGSIDLLLLPYGTALGCYTLYVLLSEQGKALFEISDFRFQISEFRLIASSNPPNRTSNPNFDLKSNLKSEI